MTDTRHPMVVRLEKILATTKAQAQVYAAAAAREAELRRTIQTLEKSLARVTAKRDRAMANMAAQRDKANGKAREYRAYALKYQSELVAARRALRNHKH